MTNHQNFLQLHQQNEAFLLANAWDAGSAKIFEKNGGKAIGTSSAAVANSLGYDDGEIISFEELFFVAERICKAISIPLSVDLERGYSNDTARVAENIKRLYDIGVVGINIEDSVKSEKKELLPVKEFAMKIETLKSILSQNNMAFFINVRTDAFLLQLPDALKTTLERLRDYENAGADGIFIPCITAENDISAAVSATHLPVNVLSMPALPSFQKLSELGVKRISIGSSLFNFIRGKIATTFIKINEEKSFASLF